jgi:hypothetical protein
MEPIRHSVNINGTVDNMVSFLPTTILTTNSASVTINVEYNRDINKAFEELYNAIISLGGNV